MEKSDVLIKHQKGLTSSIMTGANNKKVSGQSANEIIMDIFR